MSARLIAWRKDAISKAEKIYAQMRAGEGAADTSNDACWYVSIYPTYGGYDVQYWKLEGFYGSSRHMLDGEWVDFPGRFSSVEEARQVAENIVRLNLGEWP